MGASSVSPAAFCRVPGLPSLFPVPAHDEIERKSKGARARARVVRLDGLCSVAWRVGVDGSKAQEPAVLSIQF